jgi:hypothetical protein
MIVPVTYRFNKGSNHVYHEENFISFGESQVRIVLVTMQIEMTIMVDNIGWMVDVNLER